MAEVRANYNSGVGFFEVRCNALSRENYGGFSGEGWIFGRSRKNDSVWYAAASSNGFVYEI